MKLNKTLRIIHSDLRILFYLQSHAYHQLLTDIIVFARLVLNAK